MSHKGTRQLPAPGLESDGKKRLNPMLPEIIENLRHKEIVTSGLFYRTLSAGGKYEFRVRELPKNNLRILLALLPAFYVATTGT